MPISHGAAGGDLPAHADRVASDLVPPSLTVVDLHTRLAEAPASLEPLTAAIQERLHLLSGSNTLLLRWPWICRPDDEYHSRRIDEWLDRLTDGSAGSAVIGEPVEVGVVQHRIGAEPAVRWTTDKDDADTQLALVTARAIELETLLTRSNAIWQPRSYHYRLPNGQHTDTFVRFADAVQTPQDADVIRRLLLGRLEQGMGIVADTGSLTPVLIQLEAIMARFDLTVGGMQILQSYPAGRPAVRRTVEARGSRLRRRDRWLADRQRQWLAAGYVPRRARTSRVLTWLPVLARCLGRSLVRRRLVLAARADRSAPRRVVARARPPRTDRRLSVM